MDDPFLCKKAKSRIGQSQLFLSCSMAGVPEIFIGPWGGLAGLFARARCVLERGISQDCGIENNGVYSGGYICGGYKQPCFARWVPMALRGSRRWFDDVGIISHGAPLNLQCFTPPQDETRFEPRTERIPSDRRTHRSLAALLYALAGNETATWKTENVERGNTWATQPSWCQTACPSRCS